MFKRITAAALSLLFVFSIIPASALDSLSVEETTAKIVSEVTEMREESVKYFLCDDGSYIAATYAAPVHYNENGVWKEIDNTLTLSSKSGETVYSTKGGLNVTVPSELGSGKRFTATNEGYTISFGVKSIDNSLSAQAKVVETDALPSVVKMNSTAEISDEKVTASSMAQKAETLTEKQKVEKSNNEQMTVDKQSGAVVYKGFNQQSDLEYIVTSNSLKENIVVYKPQAEYVYSFDLDSDGLIPVEQPNGSIILVESEASQEAVFTLDAPYMYDANGAESYDIELSIKENGDEYVVTVEADSTWLNNSEREFPVVIDPTWSAPNSKIQDVYVINGTFANSPRSNTEIRAGRNLTNIVRSYIKLTLPTNLPIGYSLYNSTLVLKKQNYFKVSKDIDIRAYDCKDASSWSTSSISWNNQPFDNSNNGYLHSNPELLSSVAAKSDSEDYIFNITKAVSRWEKGETNNGIMLASSDESTKTQVDFYSTRATATETRPNFVMYYHDPYVSLKKWTPTCKSSVSSTVNILCRLPWTVEITPDSPWLTVTDLKAKSFKLKADENTLASERSGTVTVKTSLGNVTSVIGTIAVTQLGAEPSVVLDTEHLKVDHTKQTKTITVTSNSSWSASTDSDWIEIENGNGIGNSTFKVEVQKIPKNDDNTTNSRTGTVTVQAGTISKTITVTQLDKVSEFFNPIKSDGTCETRPSTEYNHPLALWAMNLAYSAYMPLTGDFSGLAPGLFMEDNIVSATDLLDQYGIKSVAFNTDKNDTVCHIIGHKQIYADINYNTSGDTNGGNNNGYLGILEGTGRCKPIGVFSGSNQSGLRTDDFVGTVGPNCTGNSEIIGNTLNSNNTDCMRTLVVIDIRGSSTTNDWWTDIGTQLNPKWGSFGAGMEMVLKSLYHGTGDTENCTKCNGGGCVYCKGYIPYNNISNPIFLVTGHSLGAAVANLVAEHLNSCKDTNHCPGSRTEKDIYAYTFATPKTENDITKYDNKKNQNIFNILNNNDIVTFVPTNFSKPNWSDNGWTRYGRDFRITMPLYLNSRFLKMSGTDVFGAGGHAMSTYRHWLEILPGMLNKKAEDITTEDLKSISDDRDAVGLLPRLFKVKCPVDVTLKDSDGNIVAYESARENAVYPEITERGITSYISEDNEKVFFLPFGCEDVTAKIGAYDYGTMNVALETIGAGDQLESMTYSNVSLYPGKDFEIQIDENSVPNESRLMAVAEDGTQTEPSKNPYLKSAVPDSPYGGTNIITVVTDRCITKVQFVNHDSRDTMTYARDTAGVTVVDDGETLTWRLPRNFPPIVYDIRLKDDSNRWHTTERVFELVPKPKSDTN